MKHSAFSEINEGVVSLYYQDQNLKLALAFDIFATESDIDCIMDKTIFDEHFGGKKRKKS